MAERLFGTDGLRGPVNIYPMTVDVALRLGLAAGVRFRKGSHQHRVVIGKDTRLSGYMFESALTAGLCAAGMHVIMTGPLPTPAISFLTRNMRADLGVVISASHNPYSDNGIKFFDADGFKLPDEVENEISAMVLDPDMRWPYPDSDRVGRASKIEDAGGRYIVYTKSCFPAHLTLSGLRIVREKEKPLSELAGLLHLFPQKLINVRVEKKLPFEERPAIGKAVADVEKALAGRGRVLLRYSGTEALCRVMVEAEDEDKVVRYARDLADVVSRELR